MIALALAVTLTWTFTPLWGTNAPQWARDVGHRAAVMTHEQWCRSFWRVRRPCPPKPDSAQVVASIDSLYHLVVEPPTVTVVADSAWVPK